MTTPAKYETVMTMEFMTCTLVICHDGNNGFAYYLETSDGYLASPIYSTLTSDLASTVKAGREYALSTEAVSA